MKHRNCSSGAAALILVCAAALLAGCPTPLGTGGGADFITATAGTNETKYFSLRTGESVDEGKKNTLEWDLAFHRKPDLFRLIFTNGGDTAGELSSGGQCKVYYTDKTDFERVVWSDRKVFPGYEADTAKWIGAMGEPQQVSLNVMTYVGYEAGDGASSESAFAAPFLYNQKQYYESPSMGQYKSTGRVYIITSADGAANYKIQITYEYNSIDQKDVYMVRYAECK
jgi:hypothetical protein